MPSGATLYDRLPKGADPDELFDAFEGWAADQGLTLYPHQEGALIELVSGATVIRNARPGSRNTLAAGAAPFAALPSNEPTFYTAPIKALVSEKFFALC